MKTILSLYEALLNTLFPEKCIVCSIKGVSLCDKCAESLPRTEANSLWKKDVYPVFDYKNSSVKRAIWMLKYKGIRTIARALARVIYDEVFEELENKALFHGFRDPLLIPLPLSERRRRERGFNQAEYLAEELAAHAGQGVFILSPLILFKIKDTPSQTSLKNRSERLKNVRDCFAVKVKELVKGKNIILIDDVVTTGATIHEARKALKYAGARKVIAIVVAH